MECKTHYCMMNVDGACGFRICPKGNPSYKGPEKIAKEKYEALRMRR